MKAIDYRQLATLLGSGIEILQALRTLSRHKRGLIRKTIFSIRQSIKEGSSFTEAISIQGRLFTPFEIAVIQAGEISGNLEEKLGLLADYMEKVSAWRRKIIAGMIYPVIILHAAIFIPPLPTLILQGFIPYVYAVSRALLWVYGLGLGIFLAVKISARVPLFLYVRDYLLQAIPVSRGILRSLAIARFTASLSSSYGAGISIGPSLKFAAAACGNEYIKQRILKQICIVKKGGRVTEVLQESKVFPEMVIQMVNTGEETGKMEGMLSKVSSYCEDKAEAAITILNNVVPVILYLAVAGYVAFIVISFYAGYFQELGIGF
ncbi:type II secretion system F family protein [candidate division NPL-UPA2 bacterium]|nr:type II secretion system F family protein [candidate division NPL-UPA2 bacterium]